MWCVVMRSKKWVIFAVICLISVFGVWMWSSSHRGNGRFRSEDFLTEIRRAFRVPALVAVCVRDDELVFAGASGVRKVGSDEPVTLNDAFHLGSCTKAMTATTLAILVEKGYLSWDTKVIDVFHESSSRIHRDYRSVTLLQLLSHRAGLPDDTRPDEDVFPKLRQMEGPLPKQRRELVELVLSRPPAYKPGERMVYSNYGYVIAAAMAEAVTGQSWEELTMALVFEPLGMKTAGFGPPNDAWGHKPSLFGCQPIAPGPNADNPPVLAPAGGVHCSVEDWAKFVSEHLRGLRGRSKILSEESFKFLHADRYGQGYALGWLVTEREWAGGTVLTHAGSNTLWFAVVWLAPKRNVAFLAMTNCGGNRGLRSCDAAIAEMVRRFLKGE